MENAASDATKIARDSGSQRGCSAQQSQHSTARLHASSNLHRVASEQKWHRLFNKLLSAACAAHSAPDRSSNFGGNRRLSTTVRNFGQEQESADRSAKSWREQGESDLCCEATLVCSAAAKHDVGSPHIPMYDVTLMKVG